jgi:hypothetical protein
VPSPACCTLDDHCGIDLNNYNGLGCVPLDQPGMPNPACAEVADPSTITMLTPEPVRYEGCCRPNGRCGLVMTLFAPVSFGCVDALAWGFSEADVPCIPSRLGAP